MLRPIDMSTLTFNRGRTNITTAGTKAHTDKMNSSSNEATSLPSTWLIGLANDRTTYTVSVMTKGTTAVFIISLTLSKIFVPVIPATMLALEDTGEPLSPK